MKKIARPSRKMNSSFLPKFRQTPFFKFSKLANPLPLNKRGLELCTLLTFFMTIPLVKIYLRNLLTYVIPLVY